MPNMKILFANPPYVSLSGIKDTGGHDIPLNLAYLAAYTREHVKCSISIMDAETFGLSYEEIERQIKAKEPDMVVMTCPTPAFNHVIQIAKISKKLNPETIVVVGGPHPTAFPEDTARQPCIDFVVRGEGEVTFMELVKAIKSKNKSFRHINGIAYKESGGVVVTPDRELIRNLDELPFPARDLFDLKAYYPASTKKVSSYKATSIITSRGCPYDCTHCISKLIWKRKVRYRSVKNVLDEIEECVKKYGIREFNFYDDTFTINKNYVIEICREIRKRRLHIAWICFGRVNTIDKQVVGEMKRAGCRKISFGLESGSQRILDLMRKNSTLGMARRAVKIVSEAGINVHASFMLGNLGEDAKTIRETIDFAKELELDNATFFITAPFPGTELYSIAKQKGYITESTRWEDFAPITKSAPVLVQDSLSQKDLIKWQKRAFVEFYLRPKYLIRKLRTISSLSDIKTVLEGLAIFLKVQRK